MHGGPLSRTNSRHALLAAVGDELEQFGVGAISLRGIARRAGYSHAAPGAVFGDRAGMLTAFASSGYAELAASMHRAAAATQDPESALAAVGAAYVGFALARPATFELMFRGDLLQQGDPELEAARAAAWGALADVVDAAVVCGKIAAEHADTTRIGAWSIAHGLAVLALGRHASRRSTQDDLEALTAAVTSQFAHCVFGGAYALSGR